MLERNKDKPGAKRWITAVAISATAVAVVSTAIVGTVAAQTGRLFDDVPRGHYAYDAIEWAVENEITRGCGAGFNFCPEQTLNRAQVVTFLKRYHDRFHGGTGTGTGTNTTTTTTVPQDHVLSGFGSGTYDSVTLPEGRYRVSIAVALSYTFPRTGALDDTVTTDGFHPIKQVTVMAGGPNTATDRIILTLDPPKEPVADDDRPTITRWTARGYATLVVRSGLLEVPPGRVDFTVNLDPASHPLDARKMTTLSVASTVWEITVSGG